MAAREGGSSKSRKKPGGKKGGPPGVDKAKIKGVVVAFGGRKATGAAQEIAGLNVPAKDEEAFQLWGERIKKKDKELKAAQKLVQGVRGELSALHTSAKEAGIPASRLNTLKKTLKENARDPAEVAEEIREIAWQSKALNLPLGQLALFNFKDPSPAEWEFMGEAAGKAGESMDNAPGKPGEEKNAHWVSGWKKGQKELAESTFGGGDGGKPQD